MLRKFITSVETIIIRIYKTPAPETIAFLITGLFIFYWSIVDALPSGYAGLYSLITEKIIKNNFMPPGYIPYYGPGGIPNAYPPLGFYINAIIVTALGIDQFTFLRFFAPVIALLTTLTCYFLIKEMTKSRIVAILSSVLFLTSSDFTSLHVTADGMVRGPAILFTFLGLFFYWKILNSEKITIRYLLATGIFLGLSILTHLAYGEFFAFSVIALSVGGIKKFKFRMIEVGLIALISLIVSTPWWLFVIRNFGIHPLISVVNSHSTLPNFSLSSSTPQSLGIPKIIWNLFGTPYFYLLGLPYWMIKREWHKLIWLFGTALILGESTRFLAFIGSIAIAEMVVEVIRHNIDIQPPVARNFLPALFAVLLSFIFIFTGRFVDLAKKIPPLNYETLKMATYLKQNTPSDSKYLFISEQMDGANEWLPYLAQRTPTIGHWGAEWLGDYYGKHEIMSKIIQCATKEDWLCIQRVTQKYTSRPSYLSFFRSDFQTLEEKINASGEWKPVFQDQVIIIYENVR